MKEESSGEPDRTPWAVRKDKPGIELTERPPRVSSYETALKVELAEDLVLPFDGAQESDWFWRKFRVPAALLNEARAIRAGGVSPTNS